MEEGDRTDRWCDVPPGRVALRAGGHLDSQSRLVQNVSLGCRRKGRETHFHKQPLGE
jgi:hypothetical protein